ncbi:hypothetical protein Sru01_61260 [Sphaerisporangium rufum]|uniref:Uncharacterized protein n=1 Tax=Sphaerisporangium rufum TaxID=1381558 RepID=A0A919R7Q2_9ACTN|nr:hypothetical protein Sru01_61260 [Sphaerisporangium rufum]
MAKHSAYRSSHRRCGSPGGYSTPRQSAYCQPDVPTINIADLPVRGWMHARPRAIRTRPARRRTRAGGVPGTAAGRRRDKVAPSRREPGGIGDVRLRHTLDSDSM